MQTTGSLIASLIGELAPGMQDSKNDLQSVLAGTVGAYRHATSEIGHCAGTVFIDLNDDLVTKTIDCLINCVIDDFPYQMVQSPGIHRADIHARSFTNGLQTLQDLYTVIIIFISHNL